MVSMYPYLTYGGAGPANGGLHGHCGRVGDPSPVEQDQDGKGVKARMVGCKPNVKTYYVVQYNHLLPYLHSPLDRPAGRARH